MTSGSSSGGLFLRMLVVSVLLVAALPGPGSARPMSLLSRHRRVSDQRLAEIETLLALEKMKGRVVTVPIAFGVLDPDKIGRRRRSVTDDRLSPLQRILQIVAKNPNLVEENQKVLSWPPKDEEEEEDEDRREDSGEYQLI